MADTNVNERKTPEKIKEKILEALNNKPLNAQEISKEINSNWSTVKTYVEELVKERRVKELSFANQEIYQKIIEDTYFSIPIKERERNMLKFIFYNAIQKYKEATGKDIKKTQIAKLCAEINTELNLNLPIVWYIYGPMPLMIIDSQKDYSTDFLPENAAQIKKAIEQWIKNNTKYLIRELRVEYYQKSKNTVYILKERIYRELETKKYSSISQLFFEFLTATLSYDKSFEDIISEFYGIISGADYIKLFDKPEFQNKFLLAFDALWKYIASKMLMDSLIKIGYSRQEISILLGQILENKAHIAADNIGELKEIYLENLPEKLAPPKLTSINNEARGVINKWVDSGVWRE
jgi:predicted transcriptional regulator